MDANSEPRLIDLSAAAQAVAAETEFSSDNDRAFFLRVYQTAQEVYRKRVQALGFEALGVVLDAGCGFGQWAMTLASRNERVLAQDISPFRLEVLRQIAGRVGVSNVETLAPSSLDGLPLPAASVDAVFCYGAIFFVDYRKALSEFARVLKPGGRLYFTANGYGWYLHNLIKNHNPAKDFSPRQMALETFANTARLTFGGHRPGVQIVMPLPQVRAFMERAGFTDIHAAGDGMINVGAVEGVRSFFRAAYYGMNGVYEVLCQKA